jgi:hypothetical protein
VGFRVIVGVFDQIMQITGRIIPSKIRRGFLYLSTGLILV